MATTAIWVSCLSIRDEGVNDEATLIQSRPVTGRLFDTWSVLSDDPHMVEDILFKDVGMSGRFHPRDLSPAAVLGLFILLLVAQGPHRR